MDMPQGGFLRRAIMATRIQQTIHGDVRFTSRWMRDRYFLVVYGPIAALQWLWPKHKGPFETINPNTSRHCFAPSEQPVTDARVLLKIFKAWQQAWNQRLETERFSGPAVDGPATLTDLAGLYLKLRGDELAPSTIERNRHYLTRFIEELGVDIRLTDLTEDRLIAARSRLLRQLQPTTVNSTIACLNSVLRWASNREIEVHGAYRSFRRVRVATNPRQKSWWEPHEVEIALAVASEVDGELTKQRDDVVPGTATALIACGCLIGLRYEEIIMLEWENFEFDRRNSRTGGDEPLVHVTPKGNWVPKDGESRTIPMPSRLIEALRPYRRTSGWLLNSHKSVAKRGGTKRVYRYDPKKIWLRVLKRAHALGAKLITPHGMRHSFASNLLMAGVSDVLVARWLGHADTAMVHERYGHLLAYHGDIDRVRFTSPDASPDGGKGR